MEKIKLTKIYTTDKDKQGNLLKSKKGFYTRMSIKCEQYGDKWISGFKGKDNSNWKEGDEVEIILKKNGEYLNFEVPKMEDKVSEDMNKVLNLLTTINLSVKRLEENLIKKEQGPVHTEVEYPEEDINPEDIPF